MRVFLVFLFFLFFLPPSVIAHGEVRFPLTINTIPPVSNEIVQDITNKNFRIAEDIAPDVYLLNDPIHFDISYDETLDTHSEFSWTFSDGEVLYGKSVRKSFTKPGSYIVTITNDSSLEPYTHTLLIHIVPSKPYIFPQAKISVDGKIVSSGDVYDINLRKPITFTSEDVSSSSVKFVWNFNGEIKEGQSVTHQFTNKSYLETPILRVIDKNEILSDTQISLKNTSFGENQPSYIPILTLGFLICLLVGGIGFFLKTLRK